MTRSAESASSPVGGATSALVAGGGGLAAEAVGGGDRCGPPGLESLPDERAQDAIERKMNDVTMLERVG
jgi:hypothetical protein